MPDDLRLGVGGRFTGVSVVADCKWPGMWRVRMRDGRLSDMVNLTRAKDAAVAHARTRGRGVSEYLRWDHRETPSEAPPIASNVLDGSPDSSAVTMLPAEETAI
jgi:hypothetical protein